MPVVRSVNRGRPEPNPHKQTRATGIGKRPVEGAAEVRVPEAGESGLVGDYIGDRRHHGGPDQALYAVSRELLDEWAARLDRDLPDGTFGENLTLEGIDPDSTRIGEVWRIGDIVEVEVTGPRVPCSTFRGRMGVRGWLRLFAEDGRTGAYLRVRTPGRISPGDEVVVVRPGTGRTVAEEFRVVWS